MDEKAVALLSATLGEILGTRLAKPPPSLGKFRRVLLEDSVSVHLPEALASVFPGSVNQSRQSAALKVHAVFELISRRFRDFRIEPYLRPDQASSEAVAPMLGADDLLVRDLGYFSAAGFRAIERRGARYLSRFYSNCVVRDRQGDRVDLLAELEAKGGLDREILLGGVRTPSRIVAFRAPAQAGERRRRKLRRKGRKQDGDLFALQDWNIYLTNASEEELPASSIEAIYRQRWAIEILFKSWKSGLNLSGIHARASEATAKCVVLASLILSCLAQSFILPRLERGKAGIVSPLKLASMLSVAIALCAWQDLPPGQLAAHFSRHCFYEKRSKPNQRELLEELLS